MAKELGKELQVTGKVKADVKAVVVQALRERNLLKDIVRSRALELELQLELELRKLEMVENREHREYERERKGDFQRQKELSGDKRESKLQ